MVHVVAQGDEKAVEPRSSGRLESGQKSGGVAPWIEGHLSTPPEYSLASGWRGEIPEFRPLVGLRGSHVQTILGPYFPSKRLPHTIRHTLWLDDGDSLTIHEDRPQDYAMSRRREGERPKVDRPEPGQVPGLTGETVLLSVHGLAGCHRSTYVQRLAWHAVHRGWSSYRMDMRGAGTSGLQSRFLYHAGRSDDVLSVLRFIRQRHPQAKVFLCGFSLGGAITLHLLSNLNRETRVLVDGAIAVCPPLDLAACAENIRHGFNRVYDQTFAKALWKSLQMRQNAVRELGARMPTSRPRSLVDFDHMVTAPLGGYESASHYYDLFSTVDQVQRIAVPNLVLFAKDDPLIPYAIAEQAAWSATTRVVVTDHGGHLGFIGGSVRGPKFPSVRWLEHALVHTIASHLQASSSDAPAEPNAD